ncbi:NAD-dependent epimerase/dehydratase family protein [Paenibacillus aceris]|uniref:Nucleoside-diphosphate-sugar epimerase n=1 Tax=Paenibacillus aceris TaxID=869555 RepID=A0ABS4I7Q5_9BACL|nr:NAD-dependent epimerase/dehydratase family protein [Paenibacillus aceris]MBP1966967.1 nucleoside-diphosphate-sugar epimerase [Paenibacillus aceris]NHW39331.1 NAD-dependent epimerase/dehydratase family protein [Paenibacillus aceris]
MKKVVITGAAGFLGSHLAKEVVKQGHQVIGLDNFSTGKAENIRELSDSGFFTCIACDVAEEDVRFMPALSGIDEIYHMASPASPKFYQADPFATIRVNTIGTANMLELARRNNAKLVFTSTSEAYGDPEVHPQPEEYRGNVNTWGPRACYDEAKRLGEVFCYEYAHRYGSRVKVARIFNTYSAGLRNDDGRVISNFVTQALNGHDITIYGDGTQTRSFCYVDDTVRGLLLMMERDEANGQLINLGNPVEISVMEVAHLVKSLAQSSSKLTYNPLPQDDPKVRRPVIDKAKALLGWEPFIDLREGLRLTIEAYQAQRP